jgi:hypothetical protein
MTIVGSLKEQLARTTQQFEEAITKAKNPEDLEVLKASYAIHKQQLQVQIVTAMSVARRSYLEQMMGGLMNMPGGSYSMPGGISNRAKYGPGYYDYAPLGKPRDKVGRYEDLNRGYNFLRSEIGDNIGHAGGGLIPGTPSARDNTLAHVATGEYVVNSGAVQKYGVGLFNALNSRQLPHFEDGGWSSDHRLYSTINRALYNKGYDNSSHPLTAAGAFLAGAGRAAFDANNVAAGVVEDVGRAAYKAPKTGVKKALISVGKSAGARVDYFADKYQKSADFVKDTATSVGNSVGGFAHRVWEGEPEPMVPVVDHSATEAQSKASHDSAARAAARASYWMNKYAAKPASGIAGSRGTITGDPWKQTQRSSLAWDAYNEPGAIKADQRAFEKSQLHGNAMMVAAGLENSMRNRTYDFQRSSLAHADAIFGKHVGLQGPGVTQPSIYSAPSRGGGGHAGGGGNSGHGVSADAKFLAQAQDKAASRIVGAIRYGITDAVSAH